MSVCVCVEHLNRCKTSNPYCHSRGAVNLIPSTAQRRRWFEIVISGLIIPTYLQFRHSIRPSSEPDLDISNGFTFCTAFAI